MDGKFRKVRRINKTFFVKSPKSIIFAPDLVNIAVFLYIMLCQADRKMLVAFIVQWIEQLSPKE